MRAVQLDFADPTFPASLVDLPEPELPGPDWVRVAVTAGGICGSDLHLFRPTVGPAPVLLSYVAAGMVMGHEIAGSVMEPGPECAVPVGTRVAVNPFMGCRARGIEPQCDNCLAGRHPVCRSIGSRVATRGMGLGFTTGLGGGWAEQVVVHASMLHPISEQISDRGASLHEPLAITVHGLRRRPPPTGAAVLIAGAGVIGLAALAAIRHLFPSSPVTVLAKHEHQAEAAERLGAAGVVRWQPGGAHLAELAEAAGTTVMGKAERAVLQGGFPLVVEAVGTGQAVTDALRYVDGRGAVLLLGAAGIETVDLSPIWFKEVDLVGSFGYGHEHDEHDIDTALAILADGGLPDELLVTHQFPLEDVRAAVATALDRRDARAIKVVLRP